MSLNSTSSTSATQSQLARLFDLNRVDDQVWLGDCQALSLPQLFGGQLVGQSIMAAGRSVEAAVTEGTAQVHSIHTTFLHPGINGEPVEYRVEPTQTGRTRISRQVSAMQGGHEICRSFVSASVVTEGAEGGIAHARPAPPSGTPEDAIPLVKVADPDGGLGPWGEDFSAIEVRIAPLDETIQPHSAAAPRHIWMRAVESLPDDPLVHRAAVAFASDLMLMGTAAVPHGVPTGWERSLSEQWWGISLDHTMWFYNDVRGDEWLVYEHTSPMAHASRALVQAAAFDLHGRPVCQITQETLLRRHRASA